MILSKILQPQKRAKGLYDEQLQREQQERRLFRRRPAAKRADNDVETELEKGA
jgi:hypothetical protein